MTNSLSRPEPLLDQVRQFRIVFVLFAVQSFLFIHVRTYNIDPRVGWTLFDKYLLYSEAIGVGLLFGIIAILPWKRPNALYLRSFRKDPATFRLRAALKNQLGLTFRISGIRDPRRRHSDFFRAFLTGIFVVRYSNPRYMNLEAGSDWKHRLCSSLFNARCAIVDLTDISTSVQEEIVLALDCLGPDRVLFIADSSRPVAEYMALISSLPLLRPIETQQLSFAIWHDSKAGIGEFKKHVCEFKNQLPRGTVGATDDAHSVFSRLDESASGSTDIVARSTTIEKLLIFLVAASLVAAAAFGYFYKSILVAWELLLFVSFAWLLIELVRYFLQCGGWVYRCCLISSIAGGVALTVRLFSEGNEESPGSIRGTSGGCVDYHRRIHRRGGSQRWRRIRPAQ